MTTKAPTDVATVPASLRSHSVVLLGANLVMGLGLLQIFGPGATMLICLSVAVGVSLLLLAIGAIIRGQRLVIEPGGFTNYSLFGSKAQERRWTDIEGHFAVIRIGWRDAIAYSLTAECKERVGKKPTSRLSGYDEAFPALYQLSAVQLTLLLNNRKRDGLRAPETSGGAAAAESRRG